jgi:SPP1 gp7 family putative phage head morphogenesis protein
MAIFLTEVIVPEIKQIVEKLNEEMMYEDFGLEYYYDFVDPTPANRELQLRENSEGIQFGYKLINEVRKREGDVPIKGGWSLYMPIMQQAVGGLPAEEQKKAWTKAVKEISRDSDINEKLIKDHEKSKIKKYSFAGRSELRKYLKFKENIQKKISNELHKKIKKSVEPTKRPMLVGDELRKVYANTINKKIDAKSNKLKPAMDDFALKQKIRVLAKLAKLVKSQKKISTAKIFNTEKEYEMSIDFIVPYIEEFLKEAGMESLNSIAPQEDFNMGVKRVQTFIKKRSELFAESVNNTTLQGIEDTLAEGIEASEGIRQLTDRVEEVYSYFPMYRSEVIARTEATAANNEGILESFKQSDVVNGKEWINAGDGRVREEHQDYPIGVGGEIVGTEETFTNGLQYPQEYNCRCVLGGAFIE